jgi:solute carrier family 35 protein E3
VDIDALSTVADTPLNTLNMLCVLHCIGIFTRARMPLKPMFLMAIMCIGSVAFMNFSLQMNSVGFYQVTKLLCIPCMVMIDSIVYGKHYSRRLKVTLMLVLLGVGVATVTDLTVNTAGCTAGALAVLFTTQFQIWQGQKQKQYGLDAMQINHSQSPPAAFLCGLLALIFECQGNDPKYNVLIHTFQPNEISLILLSCVLALSVNLCTYGLIGKTGPVTFQVVGHAKTCLILIGGFVLFPLPPTHLLLKNIIGIALALAGVIIYGEVKMKGEQIPRGNDFYDYFCPIFISKALDESAGAGASIEYAPVSLGAPSPSASTIPSSSPRSVHPSHSPRIPPSIPGISTGNSPKVDFNTLRGAPTVDGTEMQDIEAANNRDRSN